MRRPRDPIGPTLPTIKRLFAHSGNRCAFPRCTATLIDGSTVVGKVCHIKGARPGSARYHAQQSAAERHGFDNVMLMCGRHHDVIDADEKAYTVDRLLKMKAHQQSRVARIEDSFAEQAAHLLINQSVRSLNQSGGITAHTVRADTINLYPSNATQTPLNTLYEHLSDARDWFQRAVSTTQFPDYPPRAESCRRCKKSAALAQETLTKGRLLLPQELANECDRFLSRLARGVFEFSVTQDQGTSHGPQLAATWDAANETARQLQIILGKIEILSRKIY